MNSKKVTKLEKTIVNIINDEEIKVKNRIIGDKEFDNLMRLGKTLQTWFPEYEAVHIGKIHALNGDIMLVHKKTKKMRTIELKFSSTKATLANLSQDYLKKAKVTDKSWSRKQKQTQFYKKVCEIMKENGFSFVFETKQAFEDEGRKIRKLASEGNIDAIKAKTEITKIAKEDKVSFLEELKESYNSKNLKKFYCNMVIGNHSINNYKFDGLLDEDVTKIFYLDLKAGEISIEPSKNLEEMKEENFKIKYDEGQTNFKILYKEAKIMQVALNYKNVFQGIKNPSLNVFI